MKRLIGIFTVLYFFSMPLAAMELADYLGGLRQQADTAEKKEDFKEADVRNNKLANCLAGGGEGVSITTRQATDEEACSIIKEIMGIRLRYPTRHDIGSNVYLSYLDPEVRKNLPGNLQGHMNAILYVDTVAWAYLNSAQAHYDIPRADAFTNIVKRFEILIGNAGASSCASHLDKYIKKCLPQIMTDISHVPFATYLFKQDMVRVYEKDKVGSAVKTDGENNSVNLTHFYHYPQKEGPKINLKYIYQKPYFLDYGTPDNKPAPFFEQPINFFKKNYPSLLKKEIGKGYTNFLDTLRAYTTNKLAQKLNLTNYFPLFHPHEDKNVCGELEGFVLVFDAVKRSGLGDEPEKMMAFLNRYENKQGGFNMASFSRILGGKDLPQDGHSLTNQEKQEAREFFIKNLDLKHHHYFMLCALLINPGDFAGRNMQIRLSPEGKFQFVNIDHNPCSKGFSINIIQHLNSIVDSIGGDQALKTHIFNTINSFWKETTPFPFPSSKVTDIKKDPLIVANLGKQYMQETLDINQANLSIKALERRIKFLNTFIDFTKTPITAENLEEQLKKTGLAHEEGILEDTKINFTKNSGSFAHLINALFSRYNYVLNSALDKNDLASCMETYKFTPENAPWV